MPTCPIGPTCLGCAKCDPEYHAKRIAKRTLRGATTDYTPPDPYAEGLKAQRAINDAKHPPVTIAPPLEIHYTNGVPDAYFNDLQKLRSNR